MRSRTVVTWVGLALLVVGAIFAWAWRRQNLWGNQILNTVVFNTYRQGLRTYHESQGEYPKTLAALPLSFRNVVDGEDHDQWGFPLIYQSDGVGYILVSGGRGGESDGHDSWGLRNDYQSDVEAVDICMSWKSDQIASDKGWHQVCGK